MSSPVLDKITDIQGQVLSTLEEAQEPVANVIRRIAEAAESYVPEVTIPGTDQLPSAEELIANQFDFAGKLLDQQRAFVEALVEAAKPVSTKLAVVNDTSTTKSTKASTKKVA